MPGQWCLPDFLTNRHLRFSHLSQKRRVLTLTIFPSLTESATFMHARHDREGMLKSRGATLGISVWGCAAGTLEPLA